MTLSRVVLLGILATTGLAVGLSGCGRKAANLAPEDSTYPRVYPAPADPENAPRAPTLSDETADDEFL
ncbi:hypothetical protein [Rhodospira trueperi]|uniref:Lipoprotein-attachment site-containing protein n=1 Tax=Rhodospira trueperi TaxID=69960 RepID=A0A1G7DGS0_9PROT|nr:hypothetical protein [Rhodospira trueperi]SDE50629.1 hypothetical protein SAMN05421720_107180 [Rhodospira trueperi]